MAWTEQFSRIITERNCLILLASLFIILSIAVASAPYDPSTDKADATTNDIWVEQYAHGVHHIPYDDWDYGITQSVVVEYQGQYVVVNEKGPGHVVMMLPFYIAGIGGLFPIIVMGLALLGTYMLGKRLFSWPAGFMASLFVLFNLVVIAMWHRYYWTDASTMHLLVLAFWLLVEGNYWYNGKSLNPKTENQPNQKEKIYGMGFCVLSGLAFGLSVSTRYPTGLLIFTFLAYLAGFYLLRAWPTLRAKDVHKALIEAKPMLLLGLVFVLGLLLVLVPLMQYNSTYFGGPLNSGYDGTTLMEFSKTETLDVRNTTAGWTSNIASYLSTAFGNLFRLLPMFISRMPALIFVPIGIYCLRVRKFKMFILLSWIGINFFTYLSLEWVTMYARPNLMPFEPRYWLPSLPAIAVLGGFGIYRLANWMAKRQAEENGWPPHEKITAKILISGALVGILVLWGAVPAANYLQDPEVGDPHLQSQVQLVTTDMLLSTPYDFIESPVQLDAAIITHVSYQSIEIRSENSTLGSVEVNFMEWPTGELPEFHEDQHVWLSGMFTRPRAPPGMMPEPFIGIKHGTEDFVRLHP